MKARLAAQLFLIISIPIVVQIVQFAVLGHLQAQAEPHAAKLEQNKHHTASLLRLQHDVLHIWFNGYRDANYTATRDFDKTHADALKRIGELKAVLRENSEAVEFFKRFEVQLKRTDEPSKAQQQNEESASGNGLDSSEGREYDAILALEEDYRAIGRLVNAMVADTNQISERLGELDQNYQGVLIIGAIVEFLLIVFAAWWFRRAVAKRFQIMADNMLGMTFSHKVGRTLHGDDELADLDRAFRDMAAKTAIALREEQAVAENATDVICSLDERLAFTDANRASQAVFGYSPDELVQRRVANFIDEDSVKVAAHFERAKAGIEEPLEVRIKRADRHVVDTIWSVRWSKQDESYFCVVHDNSVRKENERLRNDLIRLISDDLRFPLFGVRNCLNHLKAGMYGELSEKGIKYRSNASKATSQMLQLVNDLLDIEHMESGNLSLERKSERVSKITEQAIVQASGLANKNGVTLESKVQENIRVFADANRMIQVLTNLLSNAVKFSPLASTVTLSAFQCDDGTVEFSVIDRGRGIPKSALPFIFERFRQTEVADATKKGGSGLGLAICKALVELHNGEITVESVENEGTTFTFRIPAADPQESTASGASQRPSAEQFSPAELSDQEDSE